MSPVDPRIAALAQALLPNGPASLIQQLAEELQSTYEDFLEYRKPEHTKP